MLTKINKTNIRGILPYPFKQYADLVTDENLDLAFTNSIVDLWSLELNKLRSLNETGPDKEKWTPNEMLQHLGDTERILCAGLLRVVRGESSCKIDLNAGNMVRNGGANRKKVENIVEDLINVRKATFSLFRSLNKTELQRTGIHWIHPVSVVAMGYIIIGHQEHHLKIIREQYFPLLPGQGI